MQCYTFLAVLSQMGWEASVQASLIPRCLQGGFDYTMILCASAHMESEVDPMPVCVNIVPCVFETNKHIIIFPLHTNDTNRPTGIVDFVDGLCIIDFKR